MNKKVLKRIKDLSKELKEETYTVYHFPSHNDYKKYGHKAKTVKDHKVNHYRRMKRLYIKNGESGLEKYVNSKLKIEENGN